MKDIKLFYIDVKGMNVAINVFNCDDLNNSGLITIEGEKNHNCKKAFKSTINSIIKSTYSQVLRDINNPNWAVSQLNAIIYEKIKQRVPINITVIREFENPKKGLKKHNDNLYLMRAGNDFLKIGRSKNVSDRVNTFESNSPFKCVLLFELKGLGYMEQDILKKHEWLNVKGEWFKTHEDIINDFILIQKEQIQ